MNDMDDFLRENKGKWFKYAAVSPNVGVIELDGNALPLNQIVTLLNQLTSIVLEKNEKIRELEDALDG